MSTKSNRPLRVATYNIRKCIGLDRRRRPGRTLDVIAALGADILALQEADKRLGERPTALPRRMIEAETDFFPVEFGGPADSLGWHGNALLVRRGTEVLRAERLTIPSLEPRGAIIAEVRQSGQVMRIVATHLGLTRRHRQRQLAAIREAVALRPPLPTLILGDFNEWSPSKGLGPLQSGFTVLAPGRSFHAARPVAALDRIAHDSSFEMRDAGVIETKTAQIASDHLPIWADLRAA